jgi:hypothetical protein
VIVAAGIGEGEDLLGGGRVGGGEKDGKDDNDDKDEGTAGFHNVSRD